MKFTKVSEFQDKNNELSSNIKIIGIATPQSEKLQTKGEVSIYAFPTGEKDEAIVLIGSDEDIISLKINPFNLKIERENFPIEKSKDQAKELGERQQNKAQEIFTKWEHEKK